VVGSAERNVERDAILCGGQVMFISINLRDSVSSKRSRRRARGRCIFLYSLSNLPLSNISKAGAIVESKVLVSSLNCLVRSANLGVY